MVLQHEPPIEAEELYNFKQLEEIAAGNMDFVRALAKIYLNTIPLDSAAMVAATRAGDWAMASKLAHKLKSTVDTMNMTSIRSDIRTIELDAEKKINTQTLEKLAVKVDYVINLVAKEVRRDFALG